MNKAENEKSIGYTKQHVAYALSENKYIGNKEL